MTEAFHPLTIDRWRDLERLFGKSGAYGGCWCMYWRVTRSEWGANQGDGNRRALRAVVASGAPVGVLAYENEEPVAWCALAPREDYAALERSPVRKRVDDTPVWSVTCFFVRRDRRGGGLMARLLEAAVAYAAAEGAVAVEGYPKEPTKELAPVSSYMGVASAFAAAGFVEVGRNRSGPVMRRHVRDA